MPDKTGLWNRRQFLASLTALGAASFTTPLRGARANTSPKLKLGFDNFSIRAFGWKAPRLIEYASSVNVDTLLLSDLNVYESLDEETRGLLRSSLHLGIVVDELRDEIGPGGSVVESSSGSTSIAANDLTLHCTGSVPSQFGIFFAKNDGSKETGYLVDHTSAMTLIGSPQHDRRS